MKLPQTLLTLKLLNGPLLEHKDQQLILSTVNYSNVGTSINQTKNVLKKYFDGQSRLTIYTDYSTIKYRTTLATQNCDVTFRRCDGFSRGSNVNKLKQFCKGNTNHSIKNQYQYKPNPVDSTGTSTTCDVCLSVMYFSRYTPIAILIHIKISKYCSSTSVTFGKK